MTDAEYQQYLNASSWVPWFSENKRSNNETTYCGYSEFDNYAWVLPECTDGVPDSESKSFREQS